MTLIETMVSLALVSGTVVLVFVSLNNQGRVAAEQFVEVDLQTQLRRGNDEIFNVLADAHLVALSEDARWVDFNYPRQMVDAAGKPVPGGLHLSMDGTVTYGVFLENVSPPIWVDNAFHHLETVDDTAEMVTVQGGDWFIDQTRDFDSNGMIVAGENMALTFTPVRFEMTTYRRDPNDLKIFNDGRNDATRNAAYPRLLGSAILDYTQNGRQYAEPNPGAGARVDVPANAWRMYTRTLTLRCYRDSTVRLAAPYNKGEGVFYMRQTKSLSPIQRANEFLDANGNGEYDEGELVNGSAGDIYGASVPFIYRGQYCPKDSDSFDETGSATRNCVPDGVEAVDSSANGRNYHSIRVVLYAVHDGRTGGLSRGIQGVKRVLSSQMSIRLRNGNSKR
jgi:hypothetical protein